MIVYHGSSVVVREPRIIQTEDAVERLRFERINNQIAFCSEASLKSLTFVESYTVGG